MELKEMKMQLEEWLNIGGHFKYKMDDCLSINGKENRVNIHLYTKTNEYSISARLPDLKKKNDKGYLGCVASCRTPRAGEFWTRGNDLPDGKFSFETWIEIVSGIVQYELVKIHKPINNQNEEKVKEIK